MKRIDRILDLAERLVVALEKLADKPAAPAPVVIPASVTVQSEPVVNQPTWIPVPTPPVIQPWPRDCYPPRHPDLGPVWPDGITICGGSRPAPGCYGNDCTGFVVVDA